MNPKKQLISHLEALITSERLAAFNKVLDDRTRYITVVLEDVFQPHNASAVVRSCDCFGIQDMHVIENFNDYNINNEIALGSYKWVNINKYKKEENSTLSTINALKQKGYRIVATTPHTNDVSLPDFNLLKGKVALMFGTELKGLSKVAMDNADEFLKIPMYGFTESFNISVSAAVILNQLTSELRKLPIDWRLSDTEKDSMKINWLQNTIKRAQFVIDDFCVKRDLDPNAIISE